MTTTYYVPQFEVYEAEKDTPRMSLKDTMKSAKDIIEECRENPEDMVGLYEVVIEEMYNGEDWDENLARYFVGPRWSEDEYYTARENVMVIHLMKVELQKKYEQVNKVFAKFQANMRGRRVRWEYPLYTLSAYYDYYNLEYKLFQLRDGNARTKIKLDKIDEMRLKKEKRLNIEAENEAYQDAVMNAYEDSDSDSDDE